jgi:hypothetical protein
VVAVEPEAAPTVGKRAPEAVAALDRTPQPLGDDPGRVTDPDDAAVVSVEHHLEAAVTRDARHDLGMKRMTPGV